MNLLNLQPTEEILDYFKGCVRRYGVGGYESTLPTNENGDLFFDFKDKSIILADDYTDILGLLYDKAVKYVDMEQRDIK